MAHSLMGPRIRERRRATGLSQTALAARVGISASYLNLIEHNKRGIGGRTLNALARELDIAPAELSEGADAGLIDALTEAAGEAPGAGAEMERVSELIGRFPGWARVIGALAQRGEAQERRLTLLSDRLAHDPFLAEAMHLILSSVTAVHSTAGILTETEGMGAEQRSRFTSNLYQESVRLTETARELVAYFDADDARGPAEEETADKLHAFWAARSFYSPELERGETAALLPELAGVGAEEVASSLNRYAAMARALPVPAFAPVARQAGWDPLPAAREMGAALTDVFFRMAHLPGDLGAPAFGLIECDAAGGVLFRKELPGFPLPRLGGACPLWPLYRAFAQPGAPIRAAMRTVAGDRYLAWAVAEPDAPAAYGLPATARAAMLFTPDPAAETLAPEIEIGAQCRICPREACPSRRAAFLLG